MTSQIADMANAVSAHDIYHLGINIFMIIDGFCIYLPLSFVTKHFLNNCVLYSDVIFRAANQTTVMLDAGRSQWGDPFDCSFCTFFPVALFIQTCMWTWFKIFMIFSNEVKRRKITTYFFSMVIHAVLFIMVLVLSVKLTGGTVHWCSGVRAELTRLNVPRLSCSSSQDVYWVTFQQKGEQTGFREPVYNFLMLSCVASWFLALALGVKIGLLAFQMVKWYQTWSKVGEKMNEYHNDNDFDDEYL